MSAPIICGGSVYVRAAGQCHGLCGKPDARLVIAYPESGWYAPIVYCECGDMWGEEGLFPRPFARGWRQRKQTQFVARWDTAHPEGTKPVYDDGDHMLTGVKVASPILDAKETP